MSLLDDENSIINTLEVAEVQNDYFLRKEKYTEWMKGRVDSRSLHCSNRQSLGHGTLCIRGVLGLQPCAELQTTRWEPRVLKLNCKDYVIYKLWDLANWRFRMTVLDLRWCLHDDKSSRMWNVTWSKISDQQSQMLARMKDRQDVKWREQMSNGRYSTWVKSYPEMNESMLDVESHENPMGRSGHVAYGWGSHWDDSAAAAIRTQWFFKT